MRRKVSSFREWLDHRRRQREQRSIGGSAGGQSASSRRALTVHHRREESVEQRHAECEQHLDAEFSPGCHPCGAPRVVSQRESKKTTEDARLLAFDVESATSRRPAPAPVPPGATLSYTRGESLGPCRVGEPCPAPLRVAMRSPLPFPCLPDRPYKILLVQVGTLSRLPPLVWCVRFIYLLHWAREKRT